MVFFNTEGIDMKNLMKILLAVVLTVAVFAVGDQASASGAKEKVYREFSLPKEVKKFPIKLSNGLTVQTTKANGKVVPVIKKGKITVWQGKALATNSKVRFTVTKNNDTFFYYSQTVSGKGNIDLIGVDKNGKVFLQDKLQEDLLLKIDFLTANTVEVAVESDYDTFASMFFMLYKDGSSKGLTYFDKSFATLIKKGSFKWTNGSIGMTYKTLKPKVSYLNGKDIINEMEIYSTWKLGYAFNDGKKFGKLEPSQKVKFLFDRSIVVNKAKGKAALKNLLGNPVASSGGVLYAYKAGSRYLVVYFEDEIATMDLVPKTMLELYGLD